MTPETAVPSKLWCKDRTIPMRLAKATSTTSFFPLLDPTASSLKRVKIHRVSSISSLQYLGFLYQLDIVS